jgi:hypothetical protein
VYEADYPMPEVFTTEKSRRIWAEVMSAKDAVSEQINIMEQSMTKVLQKHELEYMQAYNIFVKRKETELKLLIDEITNRIGDKVAND